MIYVLLLGAAAVGFALGIATACLLLSIKEEEMQLAEARRCWRQMQGRR